MKQDSRLNNSFLKNILYNFSYQMLLIIVPLITMPYISRVLGAERIGEYSFAQSLVSYFVLTAMLGTAMYGQRAVAEARTDISRRSRIFLEIFLVRCLSVFLFSGVYYLFVVSRMQNRMLYTVLMLELVAIAFDISWFFQGMELFRIITVFNGISKIAGMICIFCFVRNAGDLNLYALFSGGSMLAGYIAAWSALPGLVRIKGVGALKLFRHLAGALKLFASQFAIQVYTVLDKTMIGIITKSNLQNGYYEQSQRLIKMLITIVTAVNTVVASRVTILWNDGRKEEAKQLIVNTFRAIGAIAFPMSMGVWLIAGDVIPLYYGPGYEGVIPLVRILALLLPIIGCSNIMGIQFFVPIRREVWLTCSVMVGAIVNVCLNALFIPRYAAAGAAYASVIAELAVTFAQFWLARHLLPIGRIVRILLHYLLLACAMAVPAAALLWSGLLPGGLLTVIAEVLLCGAVYLLLLFWTKDDMLRGFADFVWNVWNKRKKGAS